MAGRPLHGSPKLGGQSYPGLADSSRSRRPTSIAANAPSSHHQLNTALLHHQHQRMQPGSRHSLSGPSVPAPPLSLASSHAKNPPLSHREQRGSVGGLGYNLPAQMTSVTTSLSSSSSATAAAAAAAAAASSALQMHHGLPQQPGAWAMPQMRHIGGPANQSTPAEQTKKSKGKKRNRANTADLDRPCQEHSFITDVNAIQSMQEGLLKLMKDFEAGKLGAFDEHCSFEKMNNVRDLQEKLGRMHFKMEADIQNAGANTKEGIDIATQNMDHLLSNLDQLSMAIQSELASTQ